MTQRLVAALMTAMAVAVLVPVAAAAAGPPLALTSLRGGATALRGISSLRVYGNQIYTTSSGGASAPGDSAIELFTRDTATGQLTKAQCVAESGAANGCEDGDGLAQVSAFAVSGDGRRAYAAGANDLVVFARDPAGGRLTERGCLKSAEPLGVCKHDAGLSAQPVWTGSSPDGRFLYLVDARSVRIFELGPDGLPVDSSCLSVDGPDSGCTYSPELASITSAALSPDGHDLYVDAGGVVVQLVRDQASGALTVAGCTSASPTERDICARPHNENSALAMSGDGSQLVVTTDGLDWNQSDVPDSLSVFTRDRTTGSLARTACLATTALSGCTRSRIVAQVTAVAANDDGSRIALGAAGPTYVVVDHPSTGVLQRGGCISAMFPRFDCSYSSKIGTGLRPYVGVSVSGALVSADPDTGSVNALVASSSVRERTLAPGRGLRIGVTVQCPATRRSDCAGSLTVRSQPQATDFGRRLGASQFTLAAGASRRFTFTLKRSAVQAMFKTRRQKRAWLEFVVADSGPFRPWTRVEPLRRPPGI